jgi:hypothetical protein
MALSRLHGSQTSGQIGADAWMSVMAALGAAANNDADHWSTRTTKTDVSQQSRKRNAINSHALPTYTAALAVVQFIGRHYFGPLAERRRRTTNATTQPMTSSAAVLTADAL